MGTTGPTGPSGVESTEKRIYTPFGPDGELTSDLSLTEQTGRCTIPSPIAPRSDAWRCFADQGETTGPFDPCFGQLGAEAVICLLAPWEPEGVRIELTRPLPVKRPVNEGNQDPWAIELVGGQRCEFVPGAGVQVANRWLNYSCDDGSDLLGSVERNRPFWSILSSQESKTSLEREQITIAWF
ncbi:MAG: hypothetical protein ACRDMA_12790 [Solirubrobacterales bacterium]